MQANVARTGRSTEEERPNEKERVMCQHSRMQSATALMPTGRNADQRKWQHLAAMLHGRHTANHHLAV